MYYLHIQHRCNANHPPNHMAPHFRKPYNLILYILAAQPRTVNLQIWMDDYNPPSLLLFNRVCKQQTNFYTHSLSPHFALCQAQYTCLYFMLQYQVTCACHREPHYANFLKYGCLPLPQFSFLNLGHSVKTLIKVRHYLFQSHTHTKPVMHIS
jgi:hypothetical protein